MLFQKNVWISILIVLLVGVGIGLFYGQHIAKQSVTDQEPIKIYKAVEVETPAAAPKPPPPGETHETGHWHGDEWHAQPHDPAEMTPGSTAKNRSESDEDWSDVTPEQRAQIEQMRAQQLADYVEKWGEPPSSDGSYYHFRDNHGNVMRQYKGAAVVSDYELRIGFAPTPAGLERYKQLSDDLWDAMLEDERNGGSAENPSVEVQRLSNEIQALVESAQGEIPFPYGIRYHGASNSGFPSEAEEKRQNAVAISDLYRRLGLDHLYEFYEVPHKWPIPNYKGE